MNAICLFCHSTEVPVERWNIRCETCKAKQAAIEQEEKSRVSVQQRQPAAVIRPEGTQETTVFVDKFGRDVPNPGYDLRNDPRGWRFTGAQPAPRTMIK